MTSVRNSARAAGLPVMTSTSISINPVVRFMISSMLGIG